MHKGSLLLGDIYNDWYYVWCVLFETTLFETDVLTLISDRAGLLAQKMQDVFNLEVEDGDSRGVPIETCLNLFPPFISGGVSMPVYALFQGVYDDANTPFDARLTYVEAKPFYKILLPSDPLSASVCFCKLLRARYTRLTVKPSYYPKPYNPVLQRLAGGNLYFPSDRLYAGRHTDIAAYLLQQPGWFYAEMCGFLEYYGVWSDVPSSETWHFCHVQYPYDYEIQVFTPADVTYEGVKTACFAPHDEAFGAGAFNADYPAVIDAPFVRTSYSSQGVTRNAIEYLDDGEGSGGFDSGFLLPESVCFVPVVHSQSGIIPVISTLAGVSRLLRRKKYGNG